MLEQAADTGHLLKYKIEAYRRWFLTDNQDSKQVLLREQEGNQIIDVFFANQNPEAFRHVVVETFH